MGFFSSLFKPATPAPKPSGEAQIVRKPNGVAVDLFWVPADHATVLAELRKVYAALYGTTIPALIWVMPAELMAYYSGHDDDALFRELCNAIGLISLGHKTMMLFTKPPPRSVRMLLQAQGIAAIPDA